MGRISTQDYFPGLTEEISAGSLWSHSREVGVVSIAESVMDGNSGGWPRTVAASQGGEHQAAVTGGKGGGCGGYGQGESYEQVDL